MSRAHDERAEDAPDQNPVLVLRRHPEVGEDEHENEDVIDAERVLDQVAGKEIDPPGPAPCQRQTTSVEGQRKRDPDQAAPDRARQADRVAARES